MSKTSCLVIASLATISAACHKDPDYCPGALNNDCSLVDATTPPDEGPTGCSSDVQCSAPKAVCDIPTTTCVQCTTAEASACSGTTPYCGSDDSCRGCVAHAECTSDACLPDGSCGSDTNVAYVDPTGTDNTSCTKVMPCTKVAKALATGRAFVKFTGSTNEQVIINSQNVTLLADVGAKLTYSSAGVILTVMGTSNVSIYDLAITDGLGGTGVGISMPTGNTAVLSLHRARLTNNAGGAISATGGALNITQSTLSGNAGGGIATSGGSLAVIQSTIATNQGGGISVGGAGVTFDIRNNFIYRNGDQDVGTYGGLNLGIAVAGTNRLEFNTIVDNRAVINSGGVICNVAAFMAPNNIIARNSLAGSTTAASAQTSGACTYPTSAIANDITGIAFVHPDLAPFDYHIATGSTAIDHGTTATTTTVDFDGDARPQGVADDQGADELKP